MKTQRIAGGRGDKPAKLALYLCVHQTTYSEYELGKLSVPVEVFIKLSRLYGVSVEYMLGLTGERLIPCADIKSP